MNHISYIYNIYSVTVFSREETSNYTVMYGACLRFWPTLSIWPGHACEVVRSPFLDLAN